jgi:hypothetical protein
MDNISFITSQFADISHAQQGKGTEVGVHGLHSTHHGVAESMLTTRIRGALQHREGVRYSSVSAVVAVRLDAAEARNRSETVEICDMVR